MYRLLIVDDEVIIADGLYEEFSQMTHLDLDVYRAYSAKAALELFNKTRIDILITDIKMPEMDGLELLKKVRENWPECRVIFLTGFKEFEYAYYALNQKVNYILKTEGYEKIVEVVQNVISDMEDHAKMRELLERTDKQNNGAFLMRQKEFLLDLLNGDDFTLEEIQKELHNHGVLLKGDLPFLLIIGHMDTMEQKIQYSEKTKLFYNIGVITDQYLSPMVNSLNILDRYDNLIWMVQPKKLFESVNLCYTEDIWGKTELFIKDTLETIQNICREVLGRTVSFVLNTKPSYWKNINEHYQILKTLMNYRIGIGKEMLLTDKEIERDNFGVFPEELRKCTVMKPHQLEALEVHMERGEKEEFIELLNSLTISLIDIPSKHFTPALELYFTISLLLLSYINRKNLIHKITFKVGLYKLFRVDEFDSWREAIVYLKQLAQIIFEIQETEEDRRAVDLVSRIKEYIELHLQEEISLIKLAEQVYLNPSYLSRLFKQLTGSNLTEYIQEVRIRKAKNMLKKSNIKVNDIAFAVGYGSATNFTRFFKKSTNMTPQEYRESLQTSK